MYNQGTFLGHTCMYFEECLLLAFTINFYSTMNILCMSMIADPQDVDMEQNMCAPDGVGLANPVNSDMEGNSSDEVQNLCRIKG